MATDLSTLPYPTFPVHESITYDGGTYQDYGARMTEGCKVRENVILVVSEYQAQGVATGRIARAVRWTGAEPEMGPTFIWADANNNYSMTVHQMQQLTEGVAIEVFVDSSSGPNNTPTPGNIPLGHVWRVDDALNITREFLYWTTPPDQPSTRTINRAVSTSTEGRVTIVTNINSYPRFQNTMHVVTMNGDAVVVSNQVLTTNNTGTAEHTWMPVDGAAALVDPGDGTLYRFGYGATSGLKWTKFSFTNGVLGGELASGMVFTDGLFAGELYAAFMGDTFHMLIPGYGSPAVSELLVVGLDGIVQERTVFDTYYNAFYDYTDEWMAIVPFSSTQSLAAQLGTGEIIPPASRNGGSAGIAWDGSTTDAVSEEVPVMSWQFDAYNDWPESFKPVGVGDGRAFTFFAGEHGSTRQQVWLTQIGVPPDIDGAMLDSRRRFVR